jgi:hypothetical protein
MGLSLSFSTLHIHAGLLLPTPSVGARDPDESSSFFATRSGREVFAFEIRLWVLPCYPFYAGEGMLGTVYTNTLARVCGRFVEKLIKEDICVRKARRIKYNYVHQN